MEKKTKLLAVTSVGAVSGYLIGKKVGFNPILASVVTGIVTFIVARKCCNKTEQPTTSTTTNKENPSNPKNTTTDLMSGVGAKGYSFFSGENLNLEDDRLFSAEGDALTIGARNCPACMSGLKCDVPYKSDYCDKMRGGGNPMKVSNPVVGSSGMANTLTGMSAYRPTLSNKRNMGIRLPLTRPNF